MFSVLLFHSYIRKREARVRRMRSPAVLMFLLVISTGGLFVVTSSTEMITLFLGLELATIPMYALTASHYDRLSSEASVKFLLIGGLGTAFMLFGMSYLYGVSGTLTSTPSAWPCSTMTPWPGWARC